MNLINKRFRVIKNLIQNQLVSSYIVSDIMNNQEIVQLNIINSEYVSKEIIDFFIKEFVTLTNLENKNVVKVFDFGLINSTDSNEHAINEYFYTNKYYKNNMHFSELVSKINENNLLDIFLQICKAICYLNLRGFIYGELNINNLIINCENKQWNIILKDLCTIKLEKQDYWSERENYINFKAPELIKGNKPTTASDIYSLGVMLLALCKVDISGNESIGKKILKFKEYINGQNNLDNKTREFYNNITKIIEKMTEQEAEKRYKNVIELVDYINKIFNKNYKAFNIEEIEKLCFNTKLVGNEDEIEKIINTYEELESHQGVNNLILVHGEQGIGKTRFLKEINHVLSMKKANVYSTYVLENSTPNSNRACIDIIRKFVSQCDEEIIEKYENDLIKFIPELGLRSSIKPLEILKGEKEKYRIISRLYSFTQEFLKNKPAVFIIDNANCMDEFSVDLLEYFDSQGLKNKNILIILSYNDAEYVSNVKFAKFVHKNLKNVNIHLNPLNNEETALMIKHTLSMPVTPIIFGTKLYGKTYGNPLFVQETLKDFLSKKIMCVDNIRGVWKLTYDSFDEMPIAATLEQALLNQLKEINKESYEILKIIAIFNTAVSIQVIKSFFSLDETALNNIINDLTNKGILCKKIEDRGFVFDFYNKVLKNLIYNKLGEQERKEKHTAAVHVLENLYASEGREDKEELIYHLEKSGDRNKVVKYCIENGDKMRNFKIMDEAVANYEKALSMLLDRDEQAITVELLIKIGDIYDEIGNITSAIKNYKKAYKFIKTSSELKLEIDTLNKIANMHYKRNELEKTLKYINKSSDVLSKLEDVEGYLENKRILANLYLQKQKHDDIVEICNYCIELCGDTYIKYKGFMSNILGNSFSQTSKVTAAIAYYEEAMKCFEEVKYFPGAAMVLNNLGAIYGDYFQDNERAIVYFNKMQEICEENNIVNLEVVALCNLGACNLDSFRYDPALQYFKASLKKSKKIEFETICFFNYNNILSIYLRTSDYSKAYEYYMLAKKEIEEYPEQGRHNALYYQISAEMYYTFGDIDTAYDLVKKALEIYNNDGSTQAKDSEILFNCLEIHRAQSSQNVLESLKNIKTLMDSYVTDFVKNNILYDVCILLFERGYKEEAIRFFKENSPNKVETNVDLINAKSFYLRGIMKENGGIKYFNYALELAKKTKNKSIQWRICVALGDYYFSKRNYFYAANYYFEACEIIKDCTLQLPEEKRINFIKNYNMLKPFNKIMGMKNKYSYNNLGENEITILNNEDLNKLFNYENFNEILNNKFFIKSAKKIYSSILPEGIRNKNDLLSNVCDDPIKILDTITKLLASFVLSTRSMIILDGYKSGYSVIAASDGRFDVPDIKLILQRVKETKKYILINEPYIEKDNIEFNYMPSDIKAVMCIPIIPREQYCYGYGKNERAKGVFDGGNIKGYLYMESERVLNNFNENSLKKCMELTAFVSFLLESYQLKVTSSTDKLTGTLTRKFLEEALAEHVEKANSHQSIFSIIMFDLDNFKAVNDKFGHQTGDEVLKEVSKVVKESVRKGDLCGRYGGEEFIIILPGTDTNRAMEIAERIRINVENKKILGDKMEVTISMGISTYPNHAKWQQELIEKADKALYVAKETGKNRFRVWDNEFTGKVKVANKLSGIVSGNAVQDSRNVLAMMDLIELIKSEDNIENKIFSLLGRIIEITEAQNGILFIVEDNKLKKKYGRKIFEECWADINNYNKKILETVIESKQGVYLIDWDEIINYDLVTGMPDWNSVVSVPLINAGVVKGVLYLAVSTKVKEFKFEDLNFINTLAQLAVSML